MPAAALKTPGLTRESLAFAAAVVRFSGRKGAAAGILVGLGAILESFGIILLVPLLAILFQSNSVVAATPWIGRIASLVPDSSPALRLSLILAAFAAVMTLRALVLWRRDAMLSELQVDFVEAQRVNIARAMANASWVALSRIGHGRINHLMGGDIQRCGAGVYFLMLSSAAFLLLIAQIGLAFLLSPILAFFAVGVMGAGALALSGLLRRSRASGAIVTEASLALMNGLGRFLGGMKVAMSQNLEHAFVAEFEHEIAAGAEQQRSFGRQQGALRAIWSLLAAAVAASTMLIGFAILHIPAPILLALLVTLARVSGPASQLHLGCQQIAYSLPAWKAVTIAEQALAAAASNLESDVRSAPPLRATVSFDCVSYRHEHDSGGGLCEVSFEIGEGEMIGLSGASGAGKTTLADLLVGLITPQSGRISVGDQRLTGRTARRWREQIAYVAQDPVLFNESIRRNMIWSSPHATDDDLWVALSVSGADEWVESLPQGLDTIVGERGALISGGERQRLAIARALMRAPALLILDEATSAIDLPAERDIMTRLRRVAPAPTILMIAHRKESLDSCDRIILLADGRVTGERKGRLPKLRGLGLSTAVNEG